MIMLFSITSHLKKASIALALAFLTIPILNATNIDVLKITTLDEAGLTFATGAQTKFRTNINGRTFQKQNAVISFNGWQYSTYYDDNRNVVLGRRKLPDGDWELIRFTDYSITSSDAHNVTVVGICEGDGTIHLAFDHHADDLNYRISKSGVATNPESVNWDASLFGPVTDQLGSVGKLTLVTYPRFFNAPNGNLMLYYRYRGSGNGDGMIQEYDAKQHDWTQGLGKFISNAGLYNGALSSNSTSRNPYLNGIFYADDRIHVTWGWRESSGGAAYNHDLNYAYSDDHGRTWCNNAGMQIGKTNSSPITIDSPGLVVAEIPQNEGLSNQYTSFFYPDGRAHVIVERNNVYEHHWRSTDGQWHVETLTFAGSRPDIVGDSNGDLFLVYVSGDSLKVARRTRKIIGDGWQWNQIYSRSEASEMGEGIIDRGRWESERILSVFGQEKPSQQLDYGSGQMIDGMPAPVHVLDFHVSSGAVAPTPLAGSSGVSTSLTLQWIPGQGSTGHHLYLGTDPAAVRQADTLADEFRGAPSAPEFQLADLETDRTYYWRVDQTKATGEIIKGIVWSFTTASASETWAGYPVELQSMDVDTGSLLGWIHVSHGDFIWSYSLGRWLCLPESFVSLAGTWMHVFQ